MFTDEPGTERIIWLFSLVLGHSRMLWGRFVLHQDLPTLLRCHAAAFDALGGVPEQILYDRMRTVFSREDPEERPHRLQRHPARVCPPLRLPAEGVQALPGEDEGQGRAAVRYIREDFFLGRSFRNLDDLNQQFRQWLDQVANVRVHATTRRVVAEHFAEERPRFSRCRPGRSKRCCAWSAASPVTA